MTMATAQYGRGSAWQALRRHFLASPLYGLTLAGAAPRELRMVPRDPWPGESSRGEELLRDEAGMSSAFLRGSAETDPLRLAWMHGFGWLRDLRAVGGDEARRAAREMVATWILEHERWSEVPWRPDVTGARITAWLGNHDFFAASADDFFRGELRQSLARQARHLTRSIRRSPAGVARLNAIHGMLAAGVAFPDGESRLGQALKLLVRELPLQVLADGGHIERSPRVQLEALRRLIEIRTMLRAGRRDVPDALDAAIERMAPMLRFFRHGDGGLALFNDSVEEEGWAIDLVLTQADAKGRPGVSAPETGFERLVANRTIVIMDAGPPAPAGVDAAAHAGTLAFEMSVGKERLIVNCGVNRLGGTAWRQAQRATAAHSTVTIADTSSAEAFPEGGLGRRPLDVSVMRQEEGGNIWVEASHDGWRDTHGVIHRRRLWLSAAGDDFRGADTLIGGAGTPFVVRFHLHPRVTASLIQEGAAVMVRLPSGAGWRVRATGGKIGLAESIYLGERGIQKRTEQITVEGEIAAGGTQVKWAFQALPKR
ncbi:putative heparinase superfamily protein [Constrictibacter sp. MBR-5]